MSYVGLVGLGVMGENLALNIASRGFQVSVYNRTREKTERFVQRLPRGSAIVPTYSLEEFVSSLERPRRVILMVKAGRPVDDILDGLAPLLGDGDVVFDCGNSFFRDTERRQEWLARRGITFMGVGVSGGEEGALKGPSVMVGGAPSGFEESRAMWEAIAARVDNEPCAGYMGLRGAGHFVKMTHNGIEYALLQLIAESYDIMTRGLGMSVEDAAQVFREWRDSELGSYLLEITVDALSVVDEETGKPLVELVMDRAEQKGTGKWTSQTAMDVGVPVPNIDAAVSARIMSSLKEQRVNAARLYGGVRTRIEGDRRELLELLRPAYSLAAITSYAQGLALISEASREYGYGTKMLDVVKVWRGGCIIRAKLLHTIIGAYEREPGLVNILFDDEIAGLARELEPSLRELLRRVKTAHIPTPVMDAALNYITSLRRERLPAHVIQALRDRFGAHEYERVDKPGRFHSSWRPGS